MVENTRAPKLRYQKSRKDSVERSTAVAYSFEQEDGPRVTYRQQSAEIYNLDMPRVQDSRHFKDQIFPYWMMDPSQLHNIAEVANQFNMKQTQNDKTMKVYKNDLSQKINENSTTNDLANREVEKLSNTGDEDKVPEVTENEVENQIIKEVESIQTKGNTFDSNERHLDSEKDNLHSTVYSEEYDNETSNNGTKMENKEVEEMTMSQKTTSHSESKKNKKENSKGGKKIKFEPNLSSLSHINLNKSSVDSSCNHKLENKHRGCQVCYECQICKEEFVRKDLPTNKEPKTLKGKAPKCPKCGTFSNKPSRLQA